jgi:hypothetical protein
LGKELLFPSNIGEDFRDRFSLVPTAAIVVPSAENAGNAGSAGNAGNAGNAGSAENAGAPRTVITVHRGSGEAAIQDSLACRARNRHI